ncbi:phospholipase A2 inhibitor and Ly6/PLAUR domain-containing protein-like [Lepidochelys kempii]|uniref:phospholipase A2 inhibitor and Ly6/PLAUR domain-containing protein-like n=1 Tax=Lepidochelys kempii TaxID=8472 RepID=UPI003C6F5301
MVSFLLCLLPALLATTSAQTIPSATLTCKTCFGQTKECSFVPGICQDNKATGGCLSVAEDIKLDGTQDMSFFKQCLSSYKSDIKVPISFTVGNGQYVRINTARCNDADNCNSGALEVPTGSTTENGLQCPTCFALNFTVCNSTITPCTGDETYCLDFTGFLKNGPSSSPFQAKGCATASAQDIKPGSTLISTPYTFSFYWGATVPAEKTPTPNPTPTTTRPAPTTPPPKTSTTTKRTTLPKTTPATTDGASPALGKFSFALYLPGLTGLLLVKLLS